MSYDFDDRRDTPLALKLKQRIRRDGPISVAEFMQACLHDSEHGYYVKQLAIGRSGDFITAPEISQVFGELMGLWAAVVWQQMGSPARINLIELGPGRGTLMRDALRAARKVPKFFSAIDVHLVESCSPLVAQQAKALHDSTAPVSWHAGLATVPAGASIVIANEFLDTLPARQLIGECERRIILDDLDRLVFQPSDGSVTEQQNYAGLAAELAQSSRSAPLAGVFIDYGHTRSGQGETLQALRGHASEHPLCSPGEADLTVHVDFESFAATLVGAGFEVDGPISQGEFLGRLGIVERASRLMSANPAKAGEIELGIARLIAPQGMGSRFKVIGFQSPGLPPLPGFA